MVSFWHVRSCSRRALWLLSPGGAWGRHRTDWGPHNASRGSLPDCFRPCDGGLAALVTGVEVALSTPHGLTTTRPVLFRSSRHRPSPGEPLDAPRLEPSWPPPRIPRAFTSRARSERSLPTVRCASCSRRSARLLVAKARVRLGSSWSSRSAGTPRGWARYGTPAQPSPDGRGARRHAKRGGTRSRQWQLPPTGGRPRLERTLG